jgi:hypothetical protein
MKSRLEFPPKPGMTMSVGWFRPDAAAEMGAEASGPTSRPSAPEMVDRLQPAPIRSKRSGRSSATELLIDRALSDRIAV